MSKPLGLAIVGVGWAGSRHAEAISELATVDKRVEIAAFVDNDTDHLQHEVPEDFVLATGACHSVREYVERAFREVEIEIEWRGEGVDEKGYDSKSGMLLIEIDPRYFRPTEVDLLLGDSSKAQRELGWRHEIGFDELVAEMVREDLTAVAHQRGLTQMPQHLDPTRERESAPLVVSAR